MGTSTLVRNIGRLAVVPGPGPRRGRSLGDAGVVAQGALLVTDGRVQWAGAEKECPALPPETTTVDVGGRAVVPGFVDPHTHAIFAGDRVQEFERRLQGVSYQQILAEGGGILATVRATRAASLEALVPQTAKRLLTMLEHGTTTVEIKTGYGLDLEHELKMLRAINHLAQMLQDRLTIVPTFMPAHAVPEEYRDNADGYVNDIVERMLPAAMAAHREQAANKPLFVDVFCEAGAFTLAQSRRILERAKAVGYRLKIHADEFEPLGGAAMAAELGAVSADHLMVTPPRERDRVVSAKVVATFLPGTTFGLAKGSYAEARAWIDAGATVALATDLNPGTCYCPSMPFMMALGTRFLGMAPGEALVASTLNAAHAVGLGGERGSLSPGYMADFVVLTTGDERDLSYRFGANPVAAVFKGGKLVAGKV